MDRDAQDEQLGQETEETLFWGAMRRLGHGLPITPIDPVLYDLATSFNRAVEEAKKILRS